MVQEQIVHHLGLNNDFVKKSFFQGVELLALSGEAGKSKKQNPPKPDVQVVYKETKKRQKIINIRLEAEG